MVSQRITFCHITRAVVRATSKLPTTVGKLACCSTCDKRSVVGNLRQQSSISRMTAKMRLKASAWKKTKAFKVLVLHNFPTKNVRMLDTAQIINRRKESVIGVHGWLCVGL